MGKEVRSQVDIRHIWRTKSGDQNEESAQSERNSHGSLASCRWDPLSWPLVLAKQDRPRLLQTRPHYHFLPMNKSIASAPPVMC